MVQNGDTTLLSYTKATGGKTGKGGKGGRATDGGLIMYWSPQDVTGLNKGDVQHCTWAIADQAAGKSGHACEPDETDTEGPPWDSGWLTWDTATGWQHEAMTGDTHMTPPFRMTMQCLCGVLCCAPAL